MPPLIHVGIVFALDLSVCFERDDSGCAAFIEFFEQPVGIEGFVGQQGAQGNIPDQGPDQGRDALHVMRVTRQQQKPDEIAKRTSTKARILLVNPPRERPMA